MYSSNATAITARLAPEAFPLESVRTSSRSLVVATLALILLASFGFRARHVGAEALSEDEWNKLEAAQDYRTHGLTAANGEHPMLMKTFVLASMLAQEHWNSSSVVQAHPDLRISEEAAVRFPSVIFGALTPLLIFLLASELFGEKVGFVAAALWAVDPAAISFNRIAKEDTFLLFFFLVANIIWLRSQRIAESGRGNPEPYYWATAAAFGAMMASKYLPHLFAISISYYYVFQEMPTTRWRLGWARFHWGRFFLIAGLVFVICSPTILLPATWRQMLTMAEEQYRGHDGYQFMGKLYHDYPTLWLRGVPWYFFFVFMAVKLPLLEVAAFLTGLVLLFRRRLGDGRYLILFWLFDWFLPFSASGGKYTRYFTVALCPVLITAAIGIHALGRWLIEYLRRFFDNPGPAAAFVHMGLALVFISFSVYASVSAEPYYRLYTNVLGGGEKRAGYYFPHDEFYDGSIRETAEWIAAHAAPGARVASETPGLTKYYLEIAGRKDLSSLSLSAANAVGNFRAGDIIVDERGRRYFTNDAVLTDLESSKQPAATLYLGRVPATTIFVL